MNRLHRGETLRRLCGWETDSRIPSEATFCRAFKEFSEGELPQKIHQVMIEDHAKEKLFGHMSQRFDTDRGTRETQKESYGSARFET